jgi:hypothetical protein
VLVCLCSNLTLAPPSCERLTDGIRTTVVPSTVCDCALGTRSLNQICTLVGRSQMGELMIR